MNILIYIVSAMIMNAGELYGYYKISGEKFSFSNPKLYFIYFLQTLLIVLNYTYTQNIIKVLVTFFIIVLMCKLLFLNKQLVECILISFIIELLIAFSEFIFMITVSLYQRVDNNILVENWQGTIFGNGFILLLFLLLVNTPIPLKIFNKLKELTVNINIKKVSLFLGIVIICESVLFYLSNYNTNNIFTIIVNFAITIIYFVIIMMLIKKESNYNTVYNKYITTLQELEEYESIINEYRVINHENQNQLNSIKGMTSNKRVREYIDEILNNKNKKNELILKQALLIPTGGLRGLIYSKLVIMKNKNINYNLHVDKKINIKLTKNISTKTMLNVCQIIGVYLDNAIEAVENLKQKNILINIYKADDIAIEIINNKENYVDINKIDKAGYTTKEGIHGYGLSLVSKILKEDPKLINEREITQNTFKQKLIIKQ